MKMGTNKTVGRSLCYALSLAGVALVAQTFRGDAIDQQPTLLVEAEPVAQEIGLPVPPPSPSPAKLTRQVADPALTQPTATIETSNTQAQVTEPVEAAIHATPAAEDLAAQFESQQLDSGWAGATEAAVTMSLLEYAPAGVTVTCKSTLCQASTVYADEAAMERFVQYGLNQLDGFTGGYLQAEPSGDSSLDVTVFLIRAEA